MEGVSLGKQRDQALVIHVMRIGVDELVKLFGSGQAGQSQPQTQHQDDNGNPAGSAPQRRCESYLQDGLIKHLFQSDASTSCNRIGW